MANITRMGQVISSLRSGSTERATPKASANKSSHSKERGKSTTGSNTAKLEDLRLRLVQRLKNINFDSTRDKNRSRQIFVESILFWEFGERLINDPGFPKLVSEMLVAFTEDTEIRENLDALLKQIAA